MAMWARSPLDMNRKRFQDLSICSVGTPIAINRPNLDSEGHSRDSTPSNLTFLDQPCLLAFWKEKATELNSPNPLWTRIRFVCWPRALSKSKQASSKLFQAGKKRESTSECVFQQNSPLGLQRNLSHPEVFDNNYFDEYLTICKTRSDSAQT